MQRAADRFRFAIPELSKLQSLMGAVGLAIRPAGLCTVVGWGKEMPRRSAPWWQISKASEAPILGRPFVCREAERIGPPRMPFPRIPNLGAARSNRAGVTIPLLHHGFLALRGSLDGCVDWGRKKGRSAQPE